MKFSILGLGTALPPHQIDQKEAARLSVEFCCSTDEEAALLPVLYRQARVRTRHMVLPPHFMAGLLRDLKQKPLSSPSDDHWPASLGTRQRMEFYAEQAGPLLVRAARQALTQSRVSSREITHLVTVSCTGFSAPGLDVDLITDLDLTPTVQRTHVGFMGCHGAINGLRAAQAFAATDPAARVMVCAVELCSLHFCSRWDPEKMVANALFADGAAAVVGGPATDIEEDWHVTATGSCVFPDSRDAMTWRIGDEGFEMTLSSQVPRLIAEHLRPWLERWLEGEGLSREDVRSWAIHPGGPRILSAVEDALELPRQATAVSREVLAEHGNMSSPTMLFILERLRQASAERPCVALGFGPGLTVEAALFR